MVNLIKMIWTGVHG